MLELGRNNWEARGGKGAVCLWLSLGKAGQTPPRVEVCLSAWGGVWQPLYLAALLAALCRQQEVLEEAASSSSRRSPVAGQRCSVAREDVMCKAAARRGAACWCARWCRCGGAPRLLPLPPSPLAAEPTWEVFPMVRTLNLPPALQLCPASVGVSVVRAPGCRIAAAALSAAALQMAVTFCAAANPLP